MSFNKIEVTMRIALLAFCLASVTQQVNSENIENQKPPKPLFATNYQVHGIVSLP